MARYLITTPEQVQFHYDVAPLAGRATAWIIDQLLLWILRYAFVFLFISTGHAIGMIAVMLGIFLLDFGYFTFFEYAMGGRTPGKKLMGLRVISSRGVKLRFPDVLMRNLLRPVDTLPAIMLLGGTVAFIDHLHRRLGDLAAETLVVRDVRLALPESVLAQHTRFNSFQADPAIRGRILARVTRHERDVIFDLMLRRNELDPEVREKIFQQAAGLFRKRFSLPEDIDYLSDEQTVLNIALLIQGDRPV